jgi:hypothetical protein
MTLRIVQGHTRQGVTPVRLVLLADSGRTIRSAKSIAVSMPDDELARQWYLEAYRHQPHEVDSGPAHLLQRMTAAGVALFESVFQATDESRRIWSAVAAKLSATRIEIYGRAYALPWEQLRADAAARPLGLAARAFVYRLGNAPVTTLRAGVLRILFVICRPGLSADIDFRAVARLLIDNPAIAASPRLHFEVLRPPTLKRLDQALRTAADEGKPYHIVHFDGHGFNGSLLFETPKAGQPERVSGQQLARVLRRGGGAVLIMNACRSAYAPVERSGAESVAWQIAKRGAPAVVAMRYNVDVLTAASFMACLYEFLGSSKDVGEAFTRALRRLDAMSAGLRIPEAWQLPVLVERSNVQFRFTRIPTGFATPAAIAEDGLPPTPPTGVLGQDLALMLLDRVLHVSPAAAIQGAPASGKTALACEFARWFARSGGLARPVLVYRDLAEFSSLSALKMDTVSRALVIIDNASEAHAAHGLHDFVQRLAGRGCKVLLVQRRAEGALLKFEGIRVLDLRRLEPAPCMEFAGGLLADEESDCRPLIPRLIQSCGRLPGLIVSVMNAARIMAVDQGTPLWTACNGLLDRFDQTGQFGIDMPAPSEWAAIDADFTADERELLAPLALFRGFAQAMVLTRTNEVVRGVPVSDGTGEFATQIENLLQRLAARSLLQTLGGGGFAIHPVARAVFARWLQPPGGFLSKLGEEPRGKLLLQAFCRANADLASQYRWSVKEGADREALSRLQFECDNLAEARRYALALTDFSLVVRLTEGIHLIAQAIGQGDLDAVAIAQAIGQGDLDAVAFMNVDSALTVWLQGRPAGVSPDALASWLEMKIVSAQHFNAWLADAARLELYRVCEQWAGPALKESPGTWSRESRHAVRHYAGAMLDLPLQLNPHAFRGEVERLEKTLHLARLTDTPQLQSEALLRLSELFYGSQPQEDPLDGNLEKAEEHAHAALQAVATGANALLRCRCFKQLAAIGTKRFYRCERDSSVDECTAFLETTRTWLERALRECQASISIVSHSDLSDIYDELGFVARMLKNCEATEENFRLAIQHAALAGQPLRAAQIKRNLGVALAQLHLRELGGAYIRSAIADFRIHSSPDAEREIAFSHELLEVYAKRT